MRAFRTFVALALLGLWLVPPAAGLALALHRAAHHGGSPGLDPGLALATTHGHHHGEATPPHDHPARAEGPVGLRHPQPLPADLTTSAVSETTEPACTGPPLLPALRAPPVALFRLHERLLL